MADEEGYQLAHPVYLDVSMMTSFLAHIEGGVTTDEESTSTEKGATEKTLRAKAGLRARLAPIGGLEVGAERAGQTSNETVLEVRASRHHTSASLFNGLYEYLLEDGQIITLTNAEELDGIRSGAIVEFDGSYLANPLESTLAYLNSFLPYFEKQQEIQKAAVDALASTAKRQQRSSGGGGGSRGNHPKQQQDPMAGLQEVIKAAEDEQENSAQQFGIAMIVRMSEDIRATPVHDVLFETSKGIKIVCTVASEYYSASTHEFLRGGTFNIIGKVTRVLAEGNTINLARRTVFGAMDNDTIRTTLGGISSEALKLDMADPIVEGPALQVLPMAIFV